MTFHKHHSIDSNSAISNSVMYFLNKYSHYLRTYCTVEYGINQQKIFCGAHLEKTHIWVILYYKIDHFCPLKRNFHPFPALWPNFWVWNLLLSNFYHLLVHLRYARSLFITLGTNDWDKSKPRCKKYAAFFWKSRVTLGHKSVFNHSNWCQKGEKRLLACLTCSNKW